MDLLETKEKHILIVIMVLVVGYFFIATVREGHNWGGDFSMYIHHAKNLAEGKPYNDTGYIFNPSLPSIGPKTYPPVLPLLLTPIYLVFGLDFQAMKVIPILFFLLSLFMIYLNFKNKLPFFSITFIIVAIGFNYYFWQFKDNILSDLPFLFFTYTTLYLSEKMYTVKKSKGEDIKNCILTGIFLYLSYGTRSVGILLLPSILLYEFMKFKKLTYKGLTVLLVFSVFFIIQNLLFHSDGSYFDQLYFDHQILFKNIESYVWNLINFWLNGYFIAPAVSLFVIISIFSLSGFLASIRKLGIYEIFFLSYTIIVIVWPANQGTRFLIPVIPLYLYYFFYFFKFLHNLNFSRNYVNKAITFFLLIVVSSVGLSYGSLYYKLGLPPIREGIHNEDSLKLFEAVKTVTNDNDVIIFRKPRVLSLMTSRSSSCYHIPKHDEDLIKYFLEIRASYLIEMKNRDYFLGSFIARNRIRFIPIYFNKKFIIYEFI